LNSLIRTSAYLCVFAFAFALNAQTAQQPDIASPKIKHTDSINVVADTVAVTETPTAQTISTIPQAEFNTMPAISIADILALAPGVTTIGGNGPRDVPISIRGSNERQTFGVRNAQIFEDGFPVTQPDGLARTDLTDPHAYSSIDIVQGPSSALYGNYATGGAIDFRTRTGSEIHGIEVGTDFGSFHYLNNYATAGIGTERFQVAAFLSNVRGDLFTTHNSFNTITGNALATIALSPRDRITLKLIANNLDTQLSIRLSKNQYLQNPFQKACTDTLNACCASVSLFTNGFNGNKQSLTATQAGLGRFDQRTIFGARWEHDLTGNTTLRNQLVFDNRDINQPTSSTSFVGTYPSWNLTSDATRRARFFGYRSTTYAGAFFNYEKMNSYVYNIVPGGNAKIGGLTQTVSGNHLNTGLRARAEISLRDNLTLVAGIGGEYTRLNALQNNLSYPINGTPTNNLINGDRTYFNVAPEVSALYRPAHTVSIHSHLGTGYGTPQASNLFVTSQGTFGNNTDLKSQRNIGIDLGADWTPASSLQATITGFYEWFHNELVTQSAGVNLQSFTFNAPASEHRGVEAAIDWHPFVSTIPGTRLRASYLYDNQIYTSYAEQLTSGTITRSFNRNGNLIPGVQPNFLNGRIIYDQPAGRLRGVGGYLEANYRDNFKLDNANLLDASGYTLLNLNLYYNPPPSRGKISHLRIYFAIENLANKTYVTSAGNITNSLDANGQQNPATVLATSTGSIYAGSPRASYGGVHWSF